MAEFERIDNRAYGYKCDKCKRVYKEVYQGEENIFCKDHLPKDAVVLNPIITEIKTEVLN